MKVGWFNSGQKVFQAILLPLNGSYDERAPSHGDIH
jgi:hypothetical protein